MNKSMLIGSILGAGVVLGGGAIASYQYVTKAPKFAEVLSVTPVKEKIHTPHEECKQVAVTHRKPVQDENRIAGSVIGGVLGGVLGHQVGGGRGKDVATIAGAAAGGYAGNQVQKNMQENDKYTKTEQHCKKVTRTSEKLLGYDVKYRLDGEIATVRMDHEPGDRIPVKEGHLVLAADNPEPAKK